MTLGFPIDTEFSLVYKYVGPSLLHGYNHLARLMSPIVSISEKSCLIAEVIVLSMFRVITAYEDKDTGNFMEVRIEGMSEWVSEWVSATTQSPVLHLPDNHLFHTSISRQAVAQPLSRPRPLKVQGQSSSYHLRGRNRPFEHFGTCRCPEDQPDQQNVQGFW